MKYLYLIVGLLFFFLVAYPQSKLLVFQTDFGLKDGAVAEMKGVALGVSLDLRLFDLTHEIPEYNIWEAACRLDQTVRYWPKGTVFVSVVDPGVGTDRKSVVVKTHSGHFIVTPDNGTLTLIAENIGIEEVREIDETTNRRAGTLQSHTFYGRDVYAYTAARLASGVISFEKAGLIRPVESLVKIPYQKPYFDNNQIFGNVPLLDIQYGNVWTNIPEALFGKLQVKEGEEIHVVIFHQQNSVYEGNIPFEKTFGAVSIGQPLLYFNSLLQVGLALNQRSFSKSFGIGSGSDWSIVLSKQ